MISMIRPKVQDYVRKSSFGFAVEKMPQEEISADFFQELPVNFSRTASGHLYSGGCPGRCRASPSNQAR